MYSKNVLGIKDINQVMHLEVGPGLAVRYFYKATQAESTGYRLGALDQKHSSKCLFLLNEQPRGYPRAEA